MNRKILKIGMLILIAIAIMAFFMLDLQQYATLDYIKNSKESFQNYYNTHTTLAVIGLFILYITITALSLPGAAIMTILFGMLFGLVGGTLIVSPASTIGATIAFLTSRFLLKDTINKKFEKQLRTINEGIKKESAFYLFALRLVPIFPFFMINILMGVTSIRVTTFSVVSLIGMLPGTIIFVYAGTQLATITSVKDILSPNIIFVFSFVGISPLILKKFLSFLRKKRHSA
jgi:uncharacterized membrane protein YdjX (TVP38/TMEM64 family)